MVKISINTDSADFQGDPSGATSHVLRRLADQFDFTANESFPMRELDGYVLHDSNGNKIGTVEVS